MYQEEKNEKMNIFTTKKYEKLEETAIFTLAIDYLMCTCIKKSHGIP